MQMAKKKSSINKWDKKIIMQAKNAPSPHLTVHPLTDPQTLQLSGLYNHAERVS